LDYIRQVFKIMELASWHTFQVLTKRSDRLVELSPFLEWPKNVWMGVSVELSAYRFRIDHLRKCGAATRFLSLEPLLGPLDNLNFSEIDWVIVGGESGPKARPLRESWVLDLRDQCQQAGVPFFFKQWGGVRKKRNGRLLEGRTWDELPHRAQALPSYTPD
jgi:protein gp37